MTDRSVAVNLVSCVFAMLLAITPATALAGEECSGCTLLGSLSVCLSSQDPEEPQVGDVVTFTYEYSAQIPGSVSCNGCTFSGGDPVLEGDDFPVLNGNQIVVERSAVAAGTTAVELTLEAETEEQCFYEDPELGCTSYYQPAFIEASSGPHEVSISDGRPTPTPTYTESPTETATPLVPPTDTPRDGGGDEDDGCAIAQPSSPSPLPLLLAVVPIVMRSRARARRHRS